MQNVVGFTRGGVEIFKDARCPRRSTIRRDPGNPENVWSLRAIRLHLDYIGDGIHRTNGIPGLSGHVVGMGSFRDRHIG